MALGSQFLKFNKLSSSTIFVGSNIIKADTPPEDESLYHEGYAVIDGTIKMYDEGNVELQVQDISVVSGIKEVGILEHDVVSEPISLGPNQNVDYYYWDEIYTTPFGLLTALQAQNNVVTLSSSSNNQEFHRVYDTVYGPSEKIILKLQDVNITPRVGNYIVFQKYYQDAFNTNEPVFQKAPNYDSTTDDLNNLPLHRISEVFVFQIKTVNLIDINTSTNTATQGSIFEITLDKSFLIPGDDNDPGAMYMAVLLNRYNEQTKEGLLKATWQRYEIHNSQLLGDNYNFTGLTEPKGRTNFLKYQNSGNLGLSNLLAEIIGTDIKTDFYGLFKSPITVLDIDDEIRDRIYYTTAGVEVHLPGIMLQENSYDFSSALNTDPPYIIPPVILKDSIKKTQIGIGDYSDLNFRGKKYGYVFYDLRIIVITDPELSMSLGYNSNRSYSLPPLTFTNTTNTNINPNLNKNASYTHFITYKVRSKHYSETLPYAGITSFNWVNGLSIPTRAAGATQYQIDLNNSILTVKISEFLNYLKDSANHFGWEADDIEIIIGEYDIDYMTTLDSTVDIINVKGIKNVRVIGVLQYGSSSASNYTLKYSSGLNIGQQKTTHDEIKINYIDWVSSPVYNLDAKLYTTADSSLTDTTYFTSLNPWLIGVIKYQEEAKKFRMKLEYNLLADKFNASSNPTFEAGNDLMTDKLISEVGVIIGSYTDDLNVIQESQDIYIYGKISPPIRKSNLQDILLRFTLDW